MTATDPTELCHCPTCTTHRKRLAHNPVRQRLEDLAAERRRVEELKVSAMADLTATVNDAHAAGLSELEIARVTQVSRVTDRPQVARQGPPLIHT